MKVETRENEDGSGELSFEFDLSVPEERAGYRWFQVLDEAHGSDRGALLLLLADEGERRVLSALRSLLEKGEPPMPEDGGPPSLHLLSAEQARVRDQLIGTIRGGPDPYRAEPGVRAGRIERPHFRRGREKRRTPGAPPRPSRNRPPRL